MMTQTLTIESEQRAANTPENLREQVGECVLIQWALEAVQAVAERLPRWSGNLEGGASPRVLLTLLTYCYASGTYGSEDVEWSSRHEADARYVTANTCSDQDLIRHFRKANRPWIEECLTWVYAKARALDSAEFARQEATDPADETSVAIRLRHRARRTVERATLFDAAMNESPPPKGKCGGV